MKRFFTACIVAPAAWTLAIAAVRTFSLITDQRALAFVSLLSFVAKWLCIWFVFLFLPIAIGLFVQHKATLRNLAIGGAAAVALPAGAAMFLVFGLASRGRLDVVALVAYCLAAAAAGLAAGAAFGITFALLGAERKSLGTRS